MQTIDGLVTGLDTTKIVEGLLSIQQSQIDLLQDRRTQTLDQQSAFKGIEAQLLTLRSQLGQLIGNVNNIFDAKTATSSDQDLVAVAATENALPGVYSIKVNSLARAHQIASQGFQDSDSLIANGTLDIRVGGGPAATITIDESNNTLAGLADAINNSDAEASAVIIKDASAGSAPYRLVLTSSRAGSANALSITNNLNDNSNGGTQPDFAISPVVQEAADAEITIGSGVGALTVKNDSNQIEEVIPGVTLDLLAADAGKEVSIVIGSDGEAARTAVEEFVDSFNSLMRFIDDQSSYDAETDSASVLLGNRSLISIQNEVRGAVNGVVGGITSQMNRLSALGIRFNAQGRLDLDGAKLNQALTGKVEGVSIKDVRRLFALGGDSDNGNIQFVLGSTRTEESAAGYEVDISIAAERATVLSTNAVAASTVIDDTNNILNIRVDGRDSSPLVLTNGTYTPPELAAHLESVINSDPELIGRDVAVAVENDHLRITSRTYGSSSNVTVAAGTALSALGFDGSESDFGQNVAGRFLVNGVEEAAKGNGQLLIGAADNAHTADLQVRVTLSQGQVQSGSDATVNVTRGIAARLDQALSSILDPGSGRLKIVNDGFDETLESIQKSIDRQNKIFKEQELALIRQFVALETTVSELQSTGNFLAAQLAGIPAIGSNNS